MTSLLWTKTGWSAAALAFAIGLACACGGSGGSSGALSCDDAGTCPNGLTCTDGFCGSSGGSSGASGGASGAGGSSATGGSGGSGGSAPECTEGLTWCAAAAACLDLARDPRHCGACGRACTAEQSCESGTCTALPEDCQATPCPNDYYCDLATGKCRPGCASDSQCPQPGFCEIATHTCACATGHHLCAGACLSDFSVESCGSACSPCPTIPNADPTCDGSRCAQQCKFGFHDCSGQCLADESADSCGTRCTPCSRPTNGSATCDGFSCGIQCNPGYHDCGGQCLPDASVDSCGSSCSPCPTRPNSTRTCIAGVCGVSCTAGYGDCDGSLANGCESSFATSLEHCGGCDRACSAANVSTPACAGGNCTGSCEPGFANCDSDLRSNGCETDLRTDVQNCGTCNRTCPSNQRCVNGTCSTCNSAVLLLGDTVTAGNNAMKAALDAAGLTTTLIPSGVSTYSGTPAASGFGAVLVPVGASYEIDMPSAGQTSIVNAHGAGTGAVFTEWASYHVESGRWTTLRSLLLIQRSSSTSGSATYTLEVAGHPIWDGLPSAFTLAISMSHGLGSLINGGSVIATCSVCSSASRAAVAARDTTGGRLVHFTHTANYSNSTWYNDPNLMKTFTNAARWATRCL
jgi:hypothetical protein